MKYIFSQTCLTHILAKRKSYADFNIEVFLDAHLFGYIYNFFFYYYVLNSKYLNRNIYKFKQNVDFFFPFLIIVIILLTLRQFDRVQHPVAFSNFSIRPVTLLNYYMHPAESFLFQRFSDLSCLTIALDSKRPYFL